MFGLIWPALSMELLFRSFENVVDRSNSGPSTKQFVSVQWLATNTAMANQSLHSETSVVEALIQPSLAPAATLTLGQS